MTRTSLASLAFVVVATLGSTGCSVRQRYYARYGHPYGYVPVRMHAVYYPGIAVAPPPPAEMAPPPPPAEAPPPPQYAAGPRPIVIHANVPGTTIVVVNPPPGGPPVMQMGPGAPAPEVAPQPAAPPPQQPAPQAEDEGWFDGE